MRTLEEMYQSANRADPSDEDFGKSDSELWDEIEREFGEKVA